MENGDEHFPDCMSALVQYFRTEGAGQGAWSMLESLRNHISKIEEEKELLKEDLRRTHGELIHAKNDLKKAVRERENALLRLRNESDVKLQANPNIAEAADQEEALKLAERFAEIYDKEWAEAEKHMEERSEITKVQELLNTAQLCYDTCLEKELEQWNGFVKAIGLRPTSDEEEKTRLSLSPELTKILIQQRKAKAVHTTKMLIQSYHDVAGSVSTRKKEFRNFINACLETFWLAVINDPPLHFEFQIKPGSKFQPEENRVFTQNGEFIWYVVWPSVKLGDKGPLLAKGVVQSTSDMKKLKFVKDENVHRHHGKDGNHH